MQENGAGDIVHLEGVFVNKYSAEKEVGDIVHLEGVFVIKFVSSFFIYSIVGLCSFL